MSLGKCISGTTVECELWRSGKSLVMQMRKSLGYLGVKFGVTTYKISTGHNLLDTLIQTITDNTNG